jgi:hypothetical protein
MKRDDIIRMAREAGDVEIDRRGRETFTYDSYGLERFSALVAAAERERACRIVTGLCISDNNANEINTKIRSNT